jgi:hypothetical protein
MSGRLLEDPCLLMTTFWILPSRLCRRWYATFRRDRALTCQVLEFPLWRLGSDDCGHAFYHYPFQIWRLSWNHRYQGNFQKVWQGLGGQAAVGPYWTSDLEPRTHISDIDTRWMLARTKYQLHHGRCLSHRTETRWTWMSTWIWTWTFRRVPLPGGLTAISVGARATISSLAG